MRIHFFYDPKINVISVINQCWKKVEEVQLHMNAHSKNMEGDLSRLNADGFQGVRVTADVFKVIKESIEYSKLTNGAYDITALPLVELWKKSADQGKLPDKDLLEKTKDKVGYRNLCLKAPDFISFKKPGMKVDLGSPASGFVCDELAKILDKNRIKHFLVDGGGEIFCRGKDQGKKPWIIGVQDPFNKEKLYCTTVLSDRGISTSGNYEKFYTIGSEAFSHIIDPVSGYPQKGAVSVTVVANTTQAANELSTAISVLGGEKGLRLAHALKRVEVLVIESKNGEIVQYKTPGFH
ncbi:MAG: FAD:protein FMN transferase [Candidatus Omnitrophica bacterium]|nr:FAD:protein FMN transferase [Candidatus Omnitrophota bacterium]